LIQDSNNIFNIRVGDCRNFNGYPAMIILNGGLMRIIRSTYKASLGLIAVILAVIVAYGNGGPFVVKYPNGDPSAKGVLAKMDFTLHPAREKQLRVVKEDLSFRFALEAGRTSNSMPLVSVTASYAIENPTKKEISVDFGFPILRGIYTVPWEFPMLPGGIIPSPAELKSSNPPSVKITVGGKEVAPEIISNSVIYGIIRQSTRNSIEAGIKNNSTLVQLIAAVRKSSGLNPPAQRTIAEVIEEGSKEDPVMVIRESVRIRPFPTAEYASAREKLRSYLIEKQHWNDRDAALFIEYAGLDFGPMLSNPYTITTAHALKICNLGPLKAIGEQKATQFFAQIASHFDKNAAESYESIFSAWGGDVRDRSVDLESGNVRLREIDIKDPQDATIRKLPNTNPNEDQTIYARVEYLDPNAGINETEKAACKAILKNLPVVFTFAPMNLLRYHVSFAPQTTQNVTIDYAQYAYLDTRGVPSYQLAYVLHPASLWNDFGPIHVQVQTPKGIACRASVPLLQGIEVSPDKAIASPTTTSRNPTYPLIQYEARLTDKKDKMGELFLAVSKSDWERFSKEQMPARATK
jgi:hypothetical protein